MSGFTVTVRRAALPAWERLQDALGSPEPLPCAGRDEWTSDSAEVRAWAAGRCAPCPALDLCDTFAAANRERWGVWAGKDRTNRIDLRRNAS